MKQSLLLEIVEYAGSVLDVNEDARTDFELLMERVDDKYNVQGMKPEDEDEVEYVINARYFSKVPA